MGSMAVVAEKMELPIRKSRADGLFNTVDHKRIGILYFVTGVLFLVVGGLEALTIRLQWARPLNNLVTGETYNQVLTQHGTVMIFFAATPIIWGILNYVMPVMIGARDVAFPRLNMMSYWCLLWGGVLTNIAWFMGGAADAGWFAYVPLSTKAFSPGVGMNAYLVGVQLGMVSTMLTSLNFIVTILKMRAPGMGFFQMPPLAWYTLMTSVVALTAGIPFMVAMVLLYFDRVLGTQFFAPGGGGDVLLWQHLFWMFGHPEVYILLLPPFACISEVVSTFSGKPLFGYRSMIAAIATISVLGWIVWMHHMYTTGGGTAVNTAFVIGTKAVSVPAAMYVFIWLGTMWGGRLRFTLPMHYATAFFFMFYIGGLTGLVNASSSVNRQFQDNLWIVGHFHYVAIGAIVFGLLAGVTYWWPKATGRMLNERIGRPGFWVLFVGFNLTFAPMLVAGLLGHPRRIYTYVPESGWGPFNAVETVGAFLQAIGILILVIAWIESLIRGRAAGNDPWDGRSLEWATPSPVPAYNFARLPQVRALDALAYEKQYGEGRILPAPEEMDHHRHGNAVHMPSPSYMPGLVGLGLLVGGFGAVTGAGTIALVGLLVIVVGCLGWAVEDARGYYLEVKEEAA